jgi:hypothetical protein
VGMENNEIITRVSFGLKSYGAKEILARDLAYKNTIEKAEHYAKISGLKILKAIKISEFFPEDRSRQMWYSSVRRSNDDLIKDDYITELPIGNIEVCLKIFCDFIAE